MQVGFGISSFRVPSEELNPLADDPELAPRLARLLVFPSVKLEPALDEDASPFREVGGRVLRGFPPDGDIDEGYFFVLLTIFATPRAIHREPQITNLGAVGSILQFGITSEISD